MWMTPHENLLIEKQKHQDNGKRQWIEQGDVEIGRALVGKRKAVPDIGFRHFFCKLGIHRMARYSIFTYPAWWCQNWTITAGVFICKRHDCDHSYIGNYKDKIYTQ